MSNKAYLIIILAIILYCNPAKAAQKEIDRFSNMSKVPDIFITSLSISPTYKEYMVNIDQYFLVYSLNNESLTKKHKILLNEKLKDNQRNSRIKKLSKFDSNKDNTVTIKEIKKILYDDVTRKNYIQKEHRKKYVLTKTKQLLENDTNNDGIIDTNEINYIDSELNIQARQITLDTFDALIGLDPNQDGTLHKREFLALAEKSYQTFDINDDKSLSPSEKNRIDLEEKRREN